MSDNVFTAGWMAELETPIPEDQWEEISDKIAEDGMSVNYEGTLLFETISENSIVENFHLHVMPTHGKKEFRNNAYDIGHRVVKESIRFYIDLWYNGTDSNQSTMTMEEFKKQCTG